MKWKQTSSRLHIKPPKALTVEAKIAVSIDDVLGELPAKLAEAQAAQSDPLLRFDDALWIQWALKALPLLREELERAQRKVAGER